ncbi:hypothetical protein Clacol_002033 [Clathrus columnatus]|uniref:Ribosome assembly protein 3 n=1 Tax=Clathrus columnatus TaxID=1419009 RepID=A0AAV5A591_9AGAM|nr:hypothetical protein Clacol_002033 [Clathrus columnatus]
MPAIKSFLHPLADRAKKKELKEKFKKFWMSSIADAFKDELEEIRKEPNLTTPRLSPLIDALASGADVHASTNDPALNEMEIVLKDSESKVPVP